MIKAIFVITLEIKGPILCTAQGEAQYGVDAYFQKDWQGDYFIGKSHIKGKLRESWCQLKHYIQSFTDQDIMRYLGDKAETVNNNPKRGILIFSDFKPCVSTDVFQNHAFHRIKVHSESGTVNEGALLIYETPFASGEVYQWRGEITAYIQPDEQKKLEQALIIGFKWITAIGANKGIGFGQVDKVTINTKTAALPDYAVNKIDAPAEFGICIHLNEPLMIGGVRSSDILLKTETVISGAIIKGAIAAAINRRSGNEINAPVDEKNTEFPVLGKFFDKIRITHGFAAREDILPLKRTVALPLSIVKFGKAYHDALDLDEIPLDKGIPEFRIDWKNDSALDSYVGMHKPRTTLTTRTAIESESRRSHENKLYTFQALCPEDESKNHLVWLSNVYLPVSSEFNDDTRRKLFTELKFIIENELNFLGKRNTSVHVSISEKPYNMFLEQNPALIDNKHIFLTLQTPALMLEPLRKHPETIGKRYKAYWEEISENSLTMTGDSFFASQTMQGGHLYFRYMKHARPEAYYPYYLTEQGSSFKLYVMEGQAEKAIKIINTWAREGLPVPEWAEKAYSNDTTPFGWRTCPFVPQNGFGEIIINHIAQVKKNKDGSINFEGEQK